MKKRLDIEGTQYWGAQSSNRVFFNDLVSEAQAMGVRLGVYTSASQWWEWILFCLNRSVCVKKFTLIDVLELQGSNHGSNLHWWLSSSSLVRRMFPIYKHQKQIQSFPLISTNFSLLGMHTTMVTLLSVISELSEAGLAQPSSNMLEMQLSVGLESTRTIIKLSKPLLLRVSNESN